MPTPQLQPKAITLEQYEALSENTRISTSDDYIRKLYYYKNYGIREYWIVDPQRKIITVNYFENDTINVQYSFDDTIKVNIYDDLFINFTKIGELLNV